MKIERLLLLLFVALASNVVAEDCVEAPATETCPENEMPTKCGNCRATCSVTVVDPDCVCIPGCMCVLNYLRNSDGICVPETQCDAPCENDYGKIYDPCGAACQKTCDNMNDPNYSCTIPTDCTNFGACRCFEGLVLNSGGQCVRPEDCPIACGPNEAYSECVGGTECEGTCADPKKRWSCFYPFCNAGCTCAAGYLRDDNGVCTSGLECFETCDGDSNARKIFCSPCGGRQTCSSINDEGVLCIPECDGKEGCDCKSGYVLHKDKCIPKRDCPFCNGKNEAYLCRKCDLSYSNIDPHCVEKDSCTEGCYCLPGYARDYHGECVKLSEISQPPCDGDLNAYYEQCGLFCEERTCKNKDTLPECKLKSCRLNGKCVCKAGYVKNSEGKCILPENCECDSYHQRSFLPPPPPPVIIPSLDIPSHSPPPDVSSQTPSPDIPSHSPPPDVSSQTPSPDIPSHDYPSYSSPHYVPSHSPSFDIPSHSSPLDIPSYDNPSYDIPSYDIPSYDIPSYNFPSHQSLYSSQCGPNEMYDMNPTVCIPEDVTCEMYFRGETRMCYPEENCSPRCRCLQEFVRNTRGECVPPQKCCEDPNSELVRNYSTCPGGTCASPNITDCDSPTWSFGCRCKEGYLKISDENPTCIPKEECCYH